MGLPITLSGWLRGFAVDESLLTFGRLIIRPKILPVTPPITGTATHSLLRIVASGLGLSISACEGQAVAPALSPCQALERPTSPCARRSLEIVILPPRLGTSCHINPLDLDRKSTRLNS